MEKKKFRLNAVDVVIIVLVVAAIAVVGYVLLSERDEVAPQSEKLKIDYVLMVTEMRSVYEDNVKVGDVVYDADTDKFVGKVVQVSSSVSKRTGTDLKTGDMVVSDLENRRDLFVTVEADAEITDNVYLVNGLTIVVGGVMNFSTPNLTQAANIVSIEPVEG
jgi:hypothetical protein